MVQGLLCCTIQLQWLIKWSCRQTFLIQSHASEIYAGNQCCSQTWYSGLTMPSLIIYLAKVKGGSSKIPTLDM